MAVLNVTPMLAVADIDAAADFLQRCLGFRLTFRAESYAYLRQGAGGIRLIGAPPGADMDDPARQMIVYVDVDNVDAHWQTHRDALTELAPGRVRPPFDQPYRQREYHAIHGPFLFMVGQDIRPASRTQENGDTA